MNRRMNSTCITAKEGAASYCGRPRPRKSIVERDLHHQMGEPRERIDKVNALCIPCFKKMVSQ